MHGVKRLFAWMIPRFDRVALQRLARSACARRTCPTTRSEQFGIDVTYMARHKFDPATSPALLKVLRRQAGRRACTCTATARPRSAGCARGGWGFRAILHEHANHGDTPWFQKVADTLLAPHTDLAIAVSESTAEFTTRARLMPAERTKVVYLGAPLDEFARAAQRRRRLPPRGASLGIAPGTIAVGTVTRLMPSKGNRVPGRGRAGDRRAGIPSARFFIVGEGELQGGARGPGAGARPRRSAGVRRLPARRGGGALGASTSWCFRRCGKARRSRCSRRWRWASRSSPPTPTACATS